MINGMNQLVPQALNQIDQMKQVSPIHTPQANKEEFMSILKDSLNTLKGKQAESTHAVQSLIDGSADDLHTVMIKTTEAQLSLEVAVQLRNRALEAYNEIKNMQF